jgi:hypothetical protein
MKKEKLKKYCDLGLSSRAIADRESVSQSTIRYWLDKHSLKTNGWFNYEEIELRRIVNESKSRNEVLSKLNRNNSSGAYKSLNRAFTMFNIDISHFRNQNEISKHTHMNKKLNNNELFIENSKTSRAAIKRRIIDDNLLNYVCFKCNQGNLWNGEKLVLILDHINGINNDNRIENLRFVCPNCNSQLATHCRKK